MFLTESLRNEHDQLLVLADWLVAATAGALPEELTQTFAMLARFKKLLKAHLAKEDRILYPAILGSPDMYTASMGRRFQEELGSLHQWAREFDKAWIAEAAQEHWDQFRAELNLLLDRLRTRIAREEEELYPALDGARKAFPN